jgi:hypothetical protein
MFAVITANIHSMETEINTLGITLIDLHRSNVLDLIAQFLPFHDVETEEEFIERTKTLQPLAVDEIPEEYITCLPFNNTTINDINCYGYCPNNSLIAVLHEPPNNEYTDMGSNLYLSIINRKKEQKNPQAVHKIDWWSPTFRQLAISRDGNWVAIIGFVVRHSENSRSEALGYKNVLEITNLSTKRMQQYDIKMTTVAFNKQGTKIILHDHYYPHQIIPLITDITGATEEPKKTFAKYCAQRGICKNLLGQ